MFACRLTSRLSRTVKTQSNYSLLPILSNSLHCLPKSQCKCPECSLPRLSNSFHFVPQTQSKVVARPVSLLQHPGFNGSGLRRFGFFSTASPQPDDKETAQSGNEQGKGAENEDTKASADAEASDKENEADSDMDLEDVSREGLVKLVLEKEELLKMKHEEFDSMKDKYMRAFAEIENVMGRTKREAENSKKYAIQNFAKGLLDVADNLGRAASVVKESFSKIDQSADTAGAVPLLKTLLEGVEMTDKQLAEVLKKAGVEKFDPLNEQFDPNTHNAVFQVPDASKPAGTVAVVLKAGYMLHDRIIRPAEVGVTVSPEE